MLKRIKLVVAYDGTNYRGWQLQKNGITIEEVLNKTLSDLLGEDIHVTGASRTDSGVHSLGNVAVFDTNTRIPAEKIAYALNERLPEDITIQDSCEVAPDWHPRKCASTKTDEYRIYNSRFPMPTRRLDTYFVYYDIDVDLMRQAAAYLIGEHDFASFCSSGSAAESTVRTIYSCDIMKDGPVITIRISGSGFLYNMVRIIAGTLLEAGLGRMDPADMERIISARDRSAAGPTAPAKGLTMIGIEY